MAAFTTKSSGMTFGLVKDHGECGLPHAIKKIKNPAMQDHPYAVHVFRNVVGCREFRVLPHWTKATIDPCIKDALELSLEPIVNGKLYGKCKVAIREKNASGTILQRLNAKNDDVKIGDDRSSIVSYVERFFTRATQENWTSLYFYNCKSPPPTYTSSLSGISGHLDPANNSRVETMDGINTPMFYIGNAGSFTELHVEDSVADSANLIHAGNDKIWIIVDREDHARLNEIVEEKLKQLTDDGDHDKAETCQFPLHHKDIIVTPSLLDEHKIRYEFVKQHAGDLVYVRFGVLHQVVNVGVNIAEAINVGSHAWNLGNDLKVLCRCERSSLSHIATNKDVNLCVRVGKPKAPAYSCGTCARMFNGKQLLEKHMKDDHDVSHPCEECDARYKNPKSLKRHRVLAHSTGLGSGRGSNLCSICDKTVKNIARHKQERHTKEVPCSGCGTSYTRHALATHVLKCIKFSCTACNKNFNSLQSLGNHKRWCKKLH